MEERNELKYCMFCGDNTEQTISNRGLKTICHECKTTVEYGYEGK
jgi:hypothetical protein